MEKFQIKHFSLTSECYKTFVSPRWWIFRKSFNNEAEIVHIQKPELVFMA